MSNLKSITAVILTNQEDGKLKEMQLDALMEDSRSEESVEVIQHLIKNHSKVCIAARFIGEGDKAYKEAYDGIKDYVSFLQKENVPALNMLDPDFYKVNDNFRDTPDGVERSFIVRLKAPKATKSTGFKL